MAGANLYVDYSEYGTSLEYSPILFMCPFYQEKILVRIVVIVNGRCNTPSICHKSMQMMNMSSHPFQWYIHWYIHFQVTCDWTDSGWMDCYGHFVASWEEGDMIVMFIFVILVTEAMIFMTMLQATWLTATTAGGGWSVGHSSTTARTPRTSPRRGSPWTWTVRRRTSTLWPPRRRWASGFLVSADTVISRTAPTATLTPTSRGASARDSSTSASTMTSALGSLL